MKDLKDNLNTDMTQEIFIMFCFIVREAKVLLTYFVEVITLFLRINPDTKQQEKMNDYG